ncbi:MAG: zinc ribbon domain-containing protein [Phycisphaerales bacterium]|nr:MAG: zinc ribbon domain-containing protein [Phycisphaerales bacterium]
MKHRHWLLVIAACFVVYAFLAIRISGLPIVNYGTNDIQACTTIVVTLVACWTLLELGSKFFEHARRGTCGSCGYSLKGLKCPECGSDLGPNRHK